MVVMAVVVVVVVAIDDVDVHDDDVPFLLYVYFLAVDDEPMLLLLLLSLAVVMVQNHFLVVVVVVDAVMKIFVIQLSYHFFRLYLIVFVNEIPDYFVMYVSNDHMYYVILITMYAICVCVKTSKIN